MYPFLLFLATVLLGTPAQPGPGRQPTFEEIVRMRIVYTVPGMDAVGVKRNVVYKSADGQALHMDVYTPSGTARSRPAVILVHGGPLPRLGAKDMGVYLSYGELLAASGFVAVTFNHRFLAGARLEDAAGDVGDLVAHVRRNAESFGIDPARLALWAFSGGGPFLAAPLRDRPEWLRAVAAYYAVLDLSQPPPGQPSETSADARASHSPVGALAAGARRAPPILVARAGLDNAWLNATIDRFVQAALTAGASLDLLNHPDGRHGFDILDDNPRSREIIRRTIQFLKDHLEP